MIKPDNPQGLLLQMKACNMQQVPEEKNTVEVLAEQQLQKLRERLLGHKVFGKCRRSFHCFPYDQFIREGKSPAGALRMFEQWAARQRVMLKMLAELKRDGHNVAFEELKEALTSDHVITGEDVPLEQTEPGVLIMFDPEKTLLLIRWLYSSRLIDAHNWVTKGKIPEDRGRCGSLTPHLLEAFPKLAAQFREPPVTHPSCPTREVHPRIKDAFKRLRNDNSWDDVLCMFPDCDFTDLWYSVNAVAIFVRNTTQDKIKKLFTRDEQATMVMWRFNYPKSFKHKLKVAWGHNSDLWIGLHEECEHQVWRRRWPAFASASTASQLGAVIVDKKMMGIELFKNSPPLRYEVLRGRYPDHCESDLTTARIVIGFPYSRDL